MSDQGREPILKLLQPPRLCRGCLHGLESSSLLATLGIRPPTNANWKALLTEEFRARLQSDIPLPESGMGMPESLGAAAGPVEALLAWMRVLQTSAGLPVRSVGRIFSIDTAGGQLTLVVPAPAPSETACILAFEWLTSLVSSLAGGDESETAFERFGEVIAALKASLGEDSGNYRFIASAQALDIPFRTLPGTVLQYGQGSRARWMNYTFTDVTPNISAMYARQKVYSAELMRQAGLPVPKHFLAEDAEQALLAASKLGYPVVVKPADLDGGVGVAAGLLEPEEVTRAFEAARKLSPNVLVEKHVEGRDYRLVVFHDELIWAIERVPASILGDGVHTVSELVEIENRNPQRGEGHRFICKPLSLNEESLVLLKRQKLSPTAIPAKDEFVRLRMAANIASGGTPSAVFDKVHPHNRELAVRAAKVFQLDLAGLDLLIPDISRSWLETGAAICEINAQPQLGAITSSHLYPQILKALVSGNGRIPVAVVVGMPGRLFQPQVLAREFASRGLRLGWATGNEVVANGRMLARNPATVFDAGRALDMCRDIDVAILYVNQSNALSSGLPFDQIDVLALAGTHFQVRDPANPQGEFSNLIQSLLLSCRGHLLIARNSGINMQKADSALFSRHDVEEDQLDAALTASLLETEARHRSPRS
jgi:cyanophycin synthetase